MSAVLIGALLLWWAVERRPRPSMRSPHRPAGRSPSPRRRRRQSDAALPDLIELLVLSIGAGALPVVACREIAGLAHPVVRPALDDVVRRVEQGERFADALAALIDHLGASAVPLVDALAAADRYGLALAPVLTRLADDARASRRRATDARARELPVRLAAPLVLCTLPSFVLLAVVPLLVSALSSLRLD
jgi:Flp pilus assembly protein TadB